MNESDILEVQGGIVLLTSFNESVLDNEIANIGQNYILLIVIEGLALKYRRGRTRMSVRSSNSFSGLVCHCFVCPVRL